MTDRSRREAWPQTSAGDVAGLAETSARMQDAPSGAGTSTPDVIIAPSPDLAACLDLRRIVFMEEQGVSEADERDDLDAAAIHLLAWRAGHPVGSARLLTFGDTGKIGRVCVLAEARGHGIGSALVRRAVAEFRSVPGVARVVLGAQTHALEFYARLGFAATGPVYDDAGIAHRDMILTLGEPSAADPAGP